ncbi:MAG: homoserine dehydrogenase [Synechococcaceae cyanobacterium SM2_3_2]|nr:homoserine dehydrogenase [Synechococcaceae cyanobacterium SM2_3_2]
MVYGLGILGLGTVGTGVAQILRHSDHPLLQAVAIRRVGVRSIDKPRDVDLAPELFTTDLSSIVTDPTVAIVMELMGGLEPARSLILSAIAHKKHIITANKAVIAKHGAEIFAAAQAAGVYVLLEAAVGGGIPILMPLRQSLAANRLSGLLGIINGTTNFILSQMTFNSMSFEAALALAQDKGYAEADPTADVDGLDAADKLAILAEIAFNLQVERDQIPCQGIRSITAADIRYAAEWGYVIKLLAIAHRHSDHVLDLRVQPTLVPRAHPLASIHQEANAVLVQGDPLGQVMLSGPGAGRGPTASAVMGDLLTLMAQLETGSQTSGLNPLLSAAPTVTAELAFTDDLCSEFYVRVIGLDQTGVIGAIGTCFGSCGVSLEGITQKACHGEQAEIVILTHTVQEKNLRAAITQLQVMPGIVGIPSVLRVLS